MILFCLSLAEADAVIAAVRKHTPLHARLRAQRRDPLTGFAGPRTVLIRDEGDGLPFLMVSYDRQIDADAAWAWTPPEEEEEVIWPENS